MALNKKILSLAVTSLFAFTATVGLNSQQAAMAANNPLSTVTAVEIVNGQRVQYFDLTLNVDWDYDNAMDRKRIQLGTGANRGGGCTVGNGTDGGLLVLLSLAVLGLIGRGFKSLRGRSAR